jgi:propionyl-CoA synthetase
MQKIADNEEFKLPATIEDPATLKKIEEALTQMGLAKARK